MTNITKFLWLFGSGILMVLGIIHLYLTFWTNKFNPVDPLVKKAMETTSPNLTNKLTLWNGWQGFNASHSSGVIFIGLINIYLAIKYFNLLETEHFFFVINILTVGFYIYLAYKYWFNNPLFGLILAFLCFTISYALVILK